MPDLIGIPVMKLNADELRQCQPHATAGERATMRLTKPDMDPPLPGPKYIYACTECAAEFLAKCMADAAPTDAQPCPNCTCESDFACPCCHFTPCLLTLPARILSAVKDQTAMALLVDLTGLKGIGDVEPQTNLENEGELRNSP